jgi:flagellar biosynthesis protein
MMEDKAKKPLKAAALKYRGSVDAAPKLVAKGSGTVAEKIIRAARESGVPIREDKDLVEVLSSLDLYKQIPEELYKAVAEVLAFVYQLSRKSKSGR